MLWDTAFSEELVLFILSCHRKRESEKLPTVKKLYIPGEAWCSTKHIDSWVQNDFCGNMMVNDT